ncbi:PEP-CTERM sorting domain-containing protein [Arsukibacterium indicum]|uniref:PEP-CTERM sorting domain-containing protein n=1 Tax=Arsukibacterium indicum TaxID=2848612 RepID=A0ABS6ML44_9GAMM|nr:PEP-CTERM sorting domain-containing protein [Arsukibacterium indicum]MBV2129079.1 PEP-CTERM sorting domain-containing protein [Arsukibacterium indicum]
MKMKMALLLSTLCVSAYANAALTTYEFNNGDDLSGWTTDRCDPASFAIVGNELQMSIDGAEQGKCGGSFYHTQGMKLDTGMSTYLAIDMFLDSQHGLTDERLGGIWGVAYSPADAISYYPIMESIVSGGVTGIQGWGTSFFPLDSSLVTLDSFNTFAYQISDGFINFLINDNLVFTSTSDNHSYFGEVILNAKNDGNSFNVRYDNLTFGTLAVDVPEPASLAVMGAGLLLLAGATKRKRSK